MNQHDVMNDRRYYLNLFDRPPDGPGWFTFELTDSVYDAEELALLATHPERRRPAQRRVYQEQWMEVLPRLAKLKELSLYARPSQELFDVACSLPDLRRLDIAQADFSDFSRISSLTGLRRFGLHACRGNTDLSPLADLPGLELVEIDACYGQTDFDVLGQLKNLRGLQFKGHILGDRNLRLPSLKPLETLENLQHLDLMTASVADRSWDSLLAFRNLERLDMTLYNTRMRERIIDELPNLKAGFLVDWDHKKKMFYEGREW